MIFDAVIITNLPAFYKINLYEAISKFKNIFVIFLGSDSCIRTQDFNMTTISFPHIFLNNKAYERRSRWQTMIALWSVLKNIQYKKIILGGWDLPEYWFFLCFNAKKKLLLALESTIEESKITGVQGMMKRFFVSRMGGILASGEPHKALLVALGYDGKIWLTTGVGLINAIAVLEKQFEFQNRFLYLGRLSKEKNLEKLITAFNAQHEFFLTIVGNGSELENLKTLAGPQIKFQAHVPNAELNVIFQQHDVLILPSIRETWGLVVEEALYHGLPVLISNKVGSRELIDRFQCGYCFDPFSTQDLLQKLALIKQNFYKLKGNIAKIDFKAIAKHQVEQFDKVLS